MSLELFLCRRYMSSHRGKGLSVITWIALAGVIVGVMSLVTVLAVMSGFDRDLRTKILGNNAHILVDVAFPSEDFESVLKEIKNEPRIRSAMPVIYGEAFMVGPSGQSEGVMLKGVDPTLVHEVLDLDRLVQKNNWKQFKGPSVILGHRLASRLQVFVGDSVTLLLNKGDFSPLGLVPRMRKLTVIDIFESGMSQFDARHGFVPIDFAEDLFEIKPSSIEVKTVDERKIPEIKEELAETLAPKANVLDWISVNQDFLKALQLEKLVMSLILGLIVLVASFNICGSLIMVVRDKLKDISILKSMGATDQFILKVFFYQGIFIGVVGTVIGSILGLALSWLLKEKIKFPLDPNVYMIDQVPVDIRMGDILMVAGGALVITAIATLYPARLASKVIPTEGLKVD